MEPREGVLKHSNDSHLNSLSLPVLFVFTCSELILKKRSSASVLFPGFLRHQLPVAPSPPHLQHMYTHTHLYTRSYTNVHTYTYIQVQTYACTYICKTHAHTHIKHLGILQQGLLLVKKTIIHQLSHRDNIKNDMKTMQMVFCKYI